MKKERSGLLKFVGTDVTVIGPDIQVGQKAPEFTVQTQDWKTFKGLRDTQGKVRVIGSLLSLTTSVCDRETRRFNEEAAALDERVVILALTMDLPYGIKNWCAASGVDRVITLSDHLKADFGRKYGVLVKEYRVLRRAAFVVDQNDSVVYAAYMPAFGNEPDYTQVLETVKRALRA